MGEESPVQSQLWDTGDTEDSLVLIEGGIKAVRRC